jgi:hypothetical protein
VSRRETPVSARPAYGGWNMQVRLGVYRSGLLFTVDRWTPGRYVTGVHGNLVRRWMSPVELDERGALDVLIESLVIYRNGRWPLENANSEE